MPITSGNYPHFSEVYNTVGSIDWLSDVCAEEAPEFVSQNQGIIASLMPDQRLGQIRTFLDATIQAQPEIQTDLNAALEQQEAMLQMAFGHSIQAFCRQRYGARRFLPLVNQTRLHYDPTLIVDFQASSERQERAARQSLTVGQR